jgi:hypothetical protein
MPCDALRMTVSPPGRPSYIPDRPHPAADALLAIWMLILDAAVAGVVFFFLIGAGLDEALDPSAPADAGETSATRVALLGLFCLMVLAVLSCALLAHKRAVIAGITQGLVAAACAVAAMVVLSPGHTDAHQQPDPATPTYDDYTGPGGPCRSGGDNDECEGTSG